MHPIIDEHPSMREFAVQQAKAAEDRDRWAEQARLRQAAYEVAAVQALEHGTTVPEPPQDPQAGHHAYRLRMEQIDKAKQAWLDEHAAELLDQLLAREDAIVGRAAELLAELDTQTDEMATLLATVRHVYARAVGPSGDSRLDSPGSNFELLLAAARTDTRMCREPFAHAMGRSVGSTIYQGAR